MRTLRKIFTSLLILIFLYQGVVFSAVEPSSALRPPLQFGHQEEQIVEKQIFKERDDRQKVDINALRFLMKLAENDLAKEHNIHVVSVLMGSVVYLAQDGVVDIDDISDIDIALEIHRSAGSQDIHRLFIKALHGRIKSSWVVDDSGSDPYDHRPTGLGLFLSVPHKKRPLPLSLPIMDDEDIPAYFIRTMLKRDHFVPYDTLEKRTLEKRTKRLLSILYYAGTFFNDTDWSIVQRRYLEAARRFSTLKELANSFEAEVQSIILRYEELKDDHTRHDAFIVHLRKMFGLLDVAHAYPHHTLSQKLHPITNSTDL